MVTVTDVNYFADIPLGKIQHISTKKIGKIEIVPLATADSSLTRAYDTLGTYVLIDISGRWTGTFSTIQSYIGQIRDILDGFQTSSQKFQSPFVNMVQNITSTTTIRRQGNINTNTSTNTNELIDTAGNFVLKGIQADDIVKNLTTGAIAEVAIGGVAATTLSLVERGTTTPIDIFPNSDTPYAVTASVKTKILNFTVEWKIPGLSFCDYKISLVQVE